jgi:lipoprotein-anchoring transpeptidase ErfK/SrfK
MKSNSDISRRDFIRFAALSFMGLKLQSLDWIFSISEFPPYERLGRVCFGAVELKSEPDQDSPTTGKLYEDEVVPWIQEVAGRKPFYINQRWVQTPEGFIYSPYLQPVRNILNRPMNVDSLIKTSFGKGMWVEVTVPYVDVILETKPTSNSWVSARVDEGMPVRFYFSQVFWVDRIEIGEGGQVYYRVNPNFYGGVDMLWAPAEAFKPITPDDLSPISPDVGDKRIIVYLLSQTLSCFESNSEVYYCRVSTGAKYDAYGNPVDKWSTPVGVHRISRKYVSLQMSGGTTGAGYDLPGIGWTSIFVTGGVAVHSTFWHNDFGVPRSHGCVNVRPKDANWLFRWSSPAVAYDPGMYDISITGEDSTIIEVVEG